MQNEYFDNKIENLNIAIEKINYLVIPSQKIFSFNKVVGNPSIKTDTKKAEV
ncbi:MAG: VanW family protein [Saprospirales bacterium]|nr:VanW family protein [Saprospirales bacterium]